MSVITFEHKPGKWSFKYVCWRAPRKGEFYLSGAIVQAWQAPNDLTTEYWVVEPLIQHRQRGVWVPVSA